jgi:hypothetical protein
VDRNRFRGDHHGRGRYCILEAESPTFTHAILSVFSASAVVES